MFKHEQDEKFLFVMAALAEVSNQEATPMKIRIYAEALKDLRIEDIERGAWTLINTRTFATFPKPGEIREAIFGKSIEKAQLAIARIEQAWAQGIDIHKNVNFKDPVLHQVIQNAGGWTVICDMRVEDWRFLRKDLEKQYAVIMGNPAAYSDAPEILWGIHGSVENKEMRKIRGAKNLVIEIGESGVKAIPYESIVEIKKIEGPEGEFIDIRGLIKDIGKEIK